MIDVGLLKDKKVIMFKKREIVKVFLWRD